MKLTLKEAFEYMRDNNYMYKGRNITHRTVITMAENGSFESLQYIGRFRTVELWDVDRKIYDMEDNDE